jgi:hypothetical protein
MISFLKKLVVVFGLLSFLTLAVTGFVPYFFFGGMVSGYWLIIHVIAGGFFSACAAGWAVLYAERNLFGSGGITAKLCFWIVVVLSLAVILSVLLSMFKLFGTDWQKILLQTHLYGTMALSLFVIAYLYLLAKSKTAQTPTK